ncbi:hypothetical protein J2Z22_001089 [Paenibacillus forsythiae]|uniref:Uncharacterized protein n=1 Tax=Paenibacillus forsythiae TaxID=365616 RepID=A0ABU3H499_9BACL|nr:hypothetical protein [Paenibacillus forsythiae]MDT3425570.1 hypothetical protein [Paenibacillus forsythiae]
MDKAYLVLRLNFISALYALVLFVQSELAVNVYRLERITGWTRTNTIVDGVNVLLFVLSSILFYFLTKRHLGNRRTRYLTCIFWIPYYALFISVFASLFPITNPGEEPLPVVGLIVMAACIVFPFYITLINLISGIFSSPVLKK